MSSSSAGAIHDLAIKMDALIKNARAMPVDADTLPLAKQAGRLVTKSIKLAPSVTAIPPVLLSCAMALGACTKLIEERPYPEIFRAPDWWAIGYDDSRIMQHPQHPKAKIWMANLDAEKDVETVNVLKGGINWQAIIRKGVDQLEAPGQNEHGAGPRMSLQSLGKELEQLERTLEMDKPKSFSPTKRKAGDSNGQGIKIEKGDAVSHKGKDREVMSGQMEVAPATNNIQLHSTDTRGRKRRRMNQMSAKHVECSDGDMQIDEIVEAPPRLEVGPAKSAGPSALKRDRASSVGLTKPQAVEPSETVTEVVQDNRCTPCKERGLDCIIGYSKKTGNRLNSCGECSMTKRKCVYSQEPETVARGPGRATSRAKSRGASQTRTRLPAIHRSKRPVELPSPSQSRRCITKGSPRVAAPNAQASGVVINLIEERLVAAEAAMAKLNAAVEQLLMNRGLYQQKVDPPYSACSLSDDPPLPLVQNAMPSPAPFKPQLTTPTAHTSSSTIPAV